VAQAEKFGARMMVARSVERLNCDEHPYRVILDDGRSLPARALVISTGAQYNKPPLPNLKRFEGRESITAPRAWRRRFARTKI